MKKLIALVGLGFAFVVSSPAFAGDQQEKMKGCNKEAKDGGMKGDERKAFMKKCLSKDYALKANGAAAAATPAAPATAAAPAGSAASTQQDRMKACNADAKGKGLKGEERKTFMSSCLKG
ncbi:MAG: PsiF repeat-containing protein [Gallionellales bacterium GWA2_59_43]|nr:MAG: PsiF repeat-containing protein [Gallionellales bacterium GWA2_59_43]